MNSTEKNCNRILRVLMALWVLFALGMALYNFFYSTPYYVLLSIGVLPIHAIPFLVYPLLRCKPSPSLTLIASLFILLAYDVGMVFSGFHIIPLYDKVVHLLSGVLFALVGLAFYYLLKQKKVMEESDCAGAIYSALSFAALSAIVWEVLEFILNLLLHNDAQKVLTTGVNDTMFDMISCMLGAILFSLMILLYYKRKKKSFLIIVFVQFFRRNFSPKNLQ